MFAEVFIWSKIANFMEFHEALSLRLVARVVNSICRPKVQEIINSNETVNDYTQILIVHCPVVRDCLSGPSLYKLVYCAPPSLHRFVTNARQITIVDVGSTNINTMHRTAELDLLEHNHYDITPTHCDSMNIKSKDSVCARISMSTFKYINIFSNTAELRLWASHTVENITKCDVRISVKPSRHIACRMEDAVRTPPHTANGRMIVSFADEHIGSFHAESTGQFMMGLNSDYGIDLIITEPLW